MTVRAGIAGVIAAALAAGLLFGVLDTGHAGRLMGLYVLGWGTAVVAAVELLRRRRRVAGSLTRQLTLAVAVSIGLSGAGVGVIAVLMFISPHDALVMAVLLLLAAALSSYSVWALTSGALADLRAVRDGLRAVGEGRRDIQIETGARDELAELAVATTEMAHQLAAREVERDAADGARRDLLAAVSHDLRTPLTSLRLLAEAIEDDLVDRETRSAYLGRMSLHLRSLSALVEDLFELSRLEAGDIQWSMQRVQLDELVHETVDAMQPQARSSQVSVAASVPPGLAAARGDPERLQRVLFNLIQNAIRHTPADGSVTVLAEMNGAGVEVEVADSGEGLAEDERERVFDAFYRAGAGKARSGDSSGLGLAICRAIVEAHGGRIWFADSQSGTRVRFSLPEA
jgi:signal transduction histidine kinase